MTLPRTRLLSLSLCLISPLTLLSQTVPPAPLPSDPVVLMSLARERNGLNSPDVHPWHIRGTYTTFDTNGKVDDTGVYEEWWVSPAKYKRSYTGTKFKQVDYATGNGLCREGTQDWPSSKEMLLRSNLIEPLPDDDALKEFKPQLHGISIGKAKLSCVKLSYPLRSNLVVPEDFFPTSCFEPTIPALRVNSQGSLRTTYNQIITFQGHYLARELHATSDGKPKFDLKLDVVEGLKEPPEALLMPPGNALPVDIMTVPLRLENGSSWLIRLKDAVPVYPPNAKDRRIQGSVVMQITIGRDGHVASLRVTSGRSELQQAALDAVRQWFYSPFRVMGEPVDVDIEVKVNFNLG